MGGGGKELERCLNRWDEVKGTENKQLAPPPTPPNPTLTQGAGEGAAPSLHLLPGGQIQDPAPRILPEIKQRHPRVQMTPKGADGSPPAASRDGVIPVPPFEHPNPAWMQGRGEAGAEEPTYGGPGGLRGGLGGWVGGVLSLSVATEDLEVFREPCRSWCVFMQHPKIGEAGEGSDLAVLQVRVDVLHQGIVRVADGERQLAQRAAPHLRVHRLQQQLRGRKAVLSPPPPSPGGHGSPPPPPPPLPSHHWVQTRMLRSRSEMGKLRHALPARWWWWSGGFPLLLPPPNPPQRIPSGVPLTLIEGQD